MRSLVLAVTLFSGLIGCRRGPEPTTTTPAEVTPPSSSTQALVSTPSNLTVDRSQHFFCPIQWTCDSFNWFTTQSACQTSAACASGLCERDVRCVAGCISPDC